MASEALILKPARIMPPGSDRSDPFFELLEPVLERLLVGDLGVESTQKPIAASGTDVLREPTVLSLEDLPQLVLSNPARPKRHHLDPYVPVVGEQLGQEELTSPGELSSQSAEPFEACRRFPTDQYKLLPARG